MKQFLVPVDGSEGANRAAQFAGQLALETKASVTLLYVYDAPTASLLGLEAISASEMDNLRNAVAKGSFEAGRRAIGDSPVQVTTHAAIGHPGHEIVTYASVNKPDAIIMGSRGLSTVRSLLLGSVSQYVVQHADCPVMIVR